MERFRRFIWQAAVLVFVAAVVALLMYRANRADHRSEPGAAKIEYTFGTIIDGPINVDPGSFLNFRFDLNRRTMLKGEFTTLAGKTKIACFVVDARNFDLLGSGSEFEKVVNTGDVLAGKIFKKLEPGTYHLVFDNRGGDAAVRANTNFAVD
jgi:ferric-dicitrate binding protein FerR (iron transport regulator)